MARKPAPRRTAIRFFCLFCGSVLARAGDRLTCATCRASFRAQDNARGCLVGVALEDCGTPDCCQFEPKRPASACRCDR